MNMLLALAVTATLNVTPIPPKPPAMPSSHQNLVGFMDGAGLVRHCGAPDDDTTGLQDVCAGYLAGAIDQIFAMLDAQPGAPPVFCGVENLNLGDVRDSVLAYMKENPGAAKIAGAHIVLNALARSYPCNGKPRP